MKTRKPTKRQMAVMIAEDVIAQIHAKKFIPTTGLYVNSDQISTGDLQKQVQKKSFKHCQVCALGSMFLSKANLFNDVTLASTYIDRESEIVPALDKYFDRRELDNIERIFEEDFSGAQNLGWLIDEFDNDESKKLEYVMREIIRQKGRFNLDRAEDHALKILHLKEKLEFEAFETSLTVLHS